MLDQCDEENDRLLSDFVCRMHQYRPPGEDDGYAMPLQSTHIVDYVGAEDPNANEAAMNNDGSIFEESDKVLGGSDKKT